MVTAGAGDMVWTAGGHALGWTERQTEQAERPDASSCSGHCSRHPSVSVSSALRSHKQSHPLLHECWAQARSSRSHRKCFTHEPLPSLEVVPL